MGRERILSGGLFIRIGQLICADLWKVLAQKFGVVEVKGVTKIVFPNIDVEAFREGSFFGEKAEDNPTTQVSRILLDTLVVNGAGIRSEVRVREAFVSHLHCFHPDVPEPYATCSYFVTKQP